MSALGPFVLVPTVIETATLDSSTIAEPASGEAAWVSGGNYTVGDKRIRTDTHRVYMALTTHSGKTTAPENDATNWKDVGPTLRWAMFDGYTSQPSVSTTSMTVVLQPGYFNALALYGLIGASYSITIKDQPGGTVIHSFSGDLYEPWPDWYEWLFAPYKPRKKVILRDLIPFPEAELTVTVAAGGGADVGIGLLVLGDLCSFILSDQIGGTQYGARVEPVDYSYIKTDEYGHTVIKKRRATTDLSVTVWLPQEDADYATRLIQDVLATPVAFVAVDAAGYETLTVFGLLSGSVSRDSFAHATAQLTIKGLI